MKKYGYDPRSGHLFSWEFDFQYEGKGGIVPEGAVISEDQESDEMVGCAFLSGWTGEFIVMRSNGGDKKFCLFGTDLRIGMWKGSEVEPQNLSKMISTMPICVCGKIAQNPEEMSMLCAMFPNSRVYACSLVDELAAFGALVRVVKSRPHRADFSRDNKEVIEAEFQEFDPSLDGDAMGRMAEIVAAGRPVVNEVKREIGVSPFYGRTLHWDWALGCQVIVRAVDMDRFFPRTPISAKNYVATSVPVQMEVSSQFKQESGYNEAFADVFMATDYVPGVSTFMRFYKTFSGRGFVFVSDHDKIRHGPIVPVFRSDKAYRVPRDKYEQSLTNRFTRNE